MSSLTTDELQRFHKHCSVDCFNSTWDLMDLRNRTADDNATMLLRATTSLWHWTQRSDCLPKNLSIGYWQVSRVCSLLGQATLAKQFGELCLHSSLSEGPFYLAYAHECLARAARLAGAKSECEHHLAEARRQVDQIADEQDRQQLTADLQTIAVLPQ